MSSTDLSQRLAALSPLKRALVALDEMQSRLDLLQAAGREPVAIIGMGCRFPGGAVDADSFWVDGYFEETSLGRIRDNDPATVRLMGYSQLIRGHVGGVSRGITVANAQPGQGGLASVNPIFTWVRLAQRIPVRIHIDHVPDGVRLVAGTTASVEVGRGA